MEEQLNMKKSISKPQEDTWYLAYDTQKNIHHFGVVSINQVMETALPSLEQFTSEELLNTRLAEFNIIIDQQEL